MPEGNELSRDRIEAPAGTHVTDRGVFTETVVGGPTSIRIGPLAKARRARSAPWQDLPGAHAFASGWLAYARDRKLFLRSLESWQFTAAPRG